MILVLQTEAVIEEAADPIEYQADTPHWDEILRLATSIKQGTVTASLIAKCRAAPSHSSADWAKSVASVSSVGTSSPLPPHTRSPSCSCASLVMLYLRKDLHFQECAHAGRTKKPEQP